jgi:phosphate-selective porin OprO/OprP
MKIKSLFLCLALACVPQALHAQPVESDAAPERGQFEAAVSPDPAALYVVPDLLPEGLIRLTTIKSRYFAMKFGLVAIPDYTAFSQDANSLSQVGRQQDQWDDRAVRLMVGGTIGDPQKVGYLIAGEYKGFDTDPTDLWQLTDVSLVFPFFSPATKLTIGKTKETFDYERVGDIANLPQQERILSPFFVSRNIGMRLSQVFGE